MDKKIIVIYNGDFAVGPAVKEAVAKKGDRVRFCNAQFFNPRDLEPAKLVVLPPDLEQAKAITKAYEGVTVVSLAEYLKGKVELPAEPAEPFNPDAPLKATKAKATK